MLPLTISSNNLVDMEYLMERERVRVVDIARYSCSIITCCPFINVVADFMQETVLVECFN